MRGTPGFVDKSPCSFHVQSVRQALICPIFILFAGKGDTGFMQGKMTTLMAVEGEFCLIFGN